MRLRPIPPCPSQIDQSLALAGESIYAGSDRTLWIGDFVLRDPLAHDEVYEGIGAGILQVVGQLLAGRKANIGASLQKVLLRSEVQRSGARNAVEVLLFLSTPK